MRKFIVGLIVGVLLSGGVAVAHHGPMHVGTYAPTSAPRWYPWRIKVRCPGAAEDTWHRLDLIDIHGQGEPGAGDDVYVYRCDLNV